MDRARKRCREHIAPQLIQLVLVEQLAKLIHMFFTKFPGFMDDEVGSLMKMAQGIVVTNEVEALTAKERRRSMLQVVVTPIELRFGHFCETMAEACRENSSNEFGMLVKKIDNLQFDTQSGVNTGPAAAAADCALASATGWRKFGRRIRRAPSCAPPMRKEFW